MVIFDRSSKDINIDREAQLSSNIQGVNDTRKLRDKQSELHSLEYPFNHTTRIIPIWGLQYIWDIEYISWDLLHT